MSLKPWYKVVTPREDLREGKPLDAAEFAVHLDQVRDGRAPSVYQEPIEFFERTYMTKNLTGFAGEVVRRLSSNQTESSAVFNMSTQFGGGKTHALTLLYHLAKNGSEADNWRGVNKIIEKSGVKTIPEADCAVFVGTEFDSISGRGGEDGTPNRKTPWGEIAYQLGGAEALHAVADHEKQMVAPGGDVIRRFLPKERPCLILMDEVMNYVSRSRKSGMASQLYNFIQNLSEEARGRSNLVLVVSVPASELEMTTEDQSDYERLKKLLDRLGKAVIMSAETETSEIIRRRLFDWVGIPDDGKKTVNEYAEWILDHKSQIAPWFPVDSARDAFAASYPFHPMALSVFERKWQSLPRFQRTRGVLRLLALWVSKAYSDGFKGAHKDPLISLGSAPLDDAFFRAAIFEQLGESHLEGPVTTDICGKKESHAIRLDQEAVDSIKKSRLHKKVATTILFESNGGQSQTYATLPEIRMAVGEPDFDLANVETVLDGLVPPNGACYFLDTSANRYWFSTRPNLTKIHADKRITVRDEKVQERIQTEIRKVFGQKDCVFFPSKSSQIADRPVLTFVILSPDRAFQGNENSTLQFIESLNRECGNSARMFKTACVWCVAEDGSSLLNEARKLLAWEAILDDAAEPGGLNIDESQEKQIAENLKKSQRDLRECVWRTYKTIVVLGKDRNLRVVDLGLIHSSAAESLQELIISRLKQDGDVETGISPNFLLRNWPPALPEWSTRSLRNAFFAAPEFPRLVDPELLKETISRGVSGGLLAYVGKDNGSYNIFVFKQSLEIKDVEFSDDVFIITKELAEAYLKKKFSAEQDASAPKESRSGTASLSAASSSATELAKQSSRSDSGGESSSSKMTESPHDHEISGIIWRGELSPQKWMNFYTKVLAKFASEKTLKIELKVEIFPESGIEVHKVEEMKVALRELGLSDDLETKETNGDSTK